jgi:hypothetical protein
MQSGSSGSGNTFSSLRMKKGQGAAIGGTGTMMPCPVKARKSRARAFLGWQRTGFEGKESTNLFSLSGDHYYY